MLNEEPILSVCLVTYNHEKYIRECMEHFISQDTRYPFEILVGDDCSTDKTAEILQNEYKDHIQLFARKQNMGLSANLLDLYKRAKGKYIFSFAGDDYLCDDAALYKMIDFLEKHKEYQGVSCWNNVYNEKEDKLYCLQKDENPTEYSLCDFLSGITPFSVTGIIRNTIYDQTIDPSFLAKGARNNEEIKTWLYELSYGKIYVMHEYLLTYRYVNRDDADNYCSNHREIDILEDYYTDIKLVEHEFGDRYNFTPLKLIWLNRYCIKFSNNRKDLSSFLKKLSLQDRLLLFGYKMYLKFHQHRSPDRWKEEAYLLKSGVGKQKR